MVQVLQRMIEIMLACMEKPALAIGDSIPRIGTYPRVLFADLPIEIGVAVVALLRHACPYPISRRRHHPDLVCFLVFRFAS